ncbi:four-carbon acid sugar kinase family protein [Halarsenatibacter silvermanii]|uniref:Uncharacterized conserved protein YgbK, DUF1537 family n=1 Tax=Halarsenatibacter silvermanii TaxID=321763 RepID=A0A1G9H8M9_9FIRM|nr:four-carbon acid sugar kinase family protein [Halarsenatibacter silvermanii]SDL09205.1 Uncharacterized conserved protein YgbK, DUF1537 family [Halarsenatibacter silvermanii]
MVEVLVIADDLTGANATGVLLSKEGFRTASFDYPLPDFESELADFAAAAVNTASRGIAAGKARERVEKTAADILESGELPELINKRLDSTLRGNIGAELDGLLAALGDDYAAVVVPAFPSSGRICVGGYLLVNSRPLERTGAAEDPKTPVNKSFVPEIISRQTGRQIGRVELREVLAGGYRLEEALRRRRQEGCEIIVCDAVEEEDIDVIARALQNIEFNFVTADPGPFTRAAASLLPGRKKAPSSKKVVMAVGSATEITREQLDYLEVNRDPALVKADVKKLLQPELRKEEISRCQNDLRKRAGESSIIGVVSARTRDDVLSDEELETFADFDEDINQLEPGEEEEIMERVTSGIAEIAAGLLAGLEEPAGIFVSGGDNVKAMLERLNARGIEVEEEIIPLAVRGRLIGGEFAGLSFVSKGGLIGDEDAMELCIDKIKAEEE